MDNKILNKNTTYYLLIFIVFCIAIILRLKFYLINRPLWHDECSLALSIINKNIFGYFSVLEHQQSAPPLFMVITKLFTLIFGTSKEYILRLLPLICGLGSIPAFYYFSKLFISRKWVLIIANFLFAINYHIIYYCQEFKQYSSDVLLFMLAFIFYSKVNIIELSFRKIFIIGIISALLPMLSIPTLFIIIAFIVSQILTHKKACYKKIILFLSPLIFIFGIYYIFVLLPQQLQKFSADSNYWFNGFLTLNLTNILKTIQINLSYQFYPNEFILFPLILGIIGIYYVIKNKKNIYCLMLLISIATIIMASFFHQYPIFERVSLYLIPIILVLITLPLNYTAYNRKFYSIFVILLTFFGLSAYNLSYAKTLLKNDLFYNTDAKTLMEVLAKNYDSLNYVVVNRASDSEFEYYKHYYNLDINKFIIVQLPEYSKENYFDILDQLPANREYWFYYPYDYSHSPVVTFLKDWSNKHEVLFEKEVKGSYLLHLNKIN